jgi:hypothetical protein
MLSFGFNSGSLVSTMVLKIINSRNNTSLCIPKNISSEKAILCFDILKNFEHGIFLKNVDSIASTIVKWNNTKKYDRFKANCQHFVIDLCQSIGVNPFDYFNKSTSFQKHLNYIIASNDCSFKWVFPKNIFRMILKEEKDYIIFETHKQLDDTYELLRICFPEFRSEYKYGKFQFYFRLSIIKGF